MLGKISGQNIGSLHENVRLRKKSLCHVMKTGIQPMLLYYSSIFSKKKDSITLPQNGTFAIWMFPKIVGFSPQIIHFYWGFPLFSPSILGKTPFWKHPYVKRADLPPNIRWGYDRLVWGLGLGWLVGCLPVPPGGIHKKVVERMQGEHIETWRYENHEWTMYKQINIYIYMYV